MARRLSFQKIVLGVALATTVVNLSSASAQTTSQEPTAKSTGDKPQTKPAADSQDPSDDKRGDDKHNGDKKREGRGDARDGRGGWSR